MKGPVLVTGAAGFIGSWLVKRLLEGGYAVRATVRDPTNAEKIRHLRDLSPESSNQLSVWRADITEEGSFDGAVQGCTGAFHVATPMNYESTEDPEEELIKAATDGVLNVLRSCKRSETVKRVVFTSSIGTVPYHPRPQEIYDETSWTDSDFCRQLDMPMGLQMYFVSKTESEKAAWDFAKENGVDLITVLPSLVAGPFLTATAPASVVAAMSLITGDETQHALLANAHLVHVDDVCSSQMLLMERSAASGRYICSGYDSTVFHLSRLLKERYPHYDVAAEFEGIDEGIEEVRFSSEKMKELGFEYRFTVGELYDDMVRCCEEKGLLPAKAKGSELGTNE